MTDRTPYQRLAQLAPTPSSNGVDFDPNLWRDLFDCADGPAPDPDQITEITHLWAISPEGYASLDLALLGRLADGRWVTCVAWADTSGFWCQSEVDWRVNDTREAAISQGLDKESRAHLGLSLPGEEPTP